MILNLTLPSNKAVGRIEYSLDINTDIKLLVTKLLLNINVKVHSKGRTTILFSPWNSETLKDSEAEFILRNLLKECNRHKVEYYVDFPVECYKELEMVMSTVHIALAAYYESSKN